MLKLFISLCGFYFATALNIKIFISNTNYGNINNWEDHRLPCDHSHITFPPKSPKVLINGTSMVHRIFEMNLPYNGVLILDDSSVFTVADVTEDSSCEVIMAHYNNIQPHFWYNPLNWCQAHSVTSPCEKKPQVEASLVPSSNDVAVFEKKNTFHVGQKSTEPNIVAREIYFRGVRFKSTLTFRNKIRRNLKENIVEFEKVNSNYPPIIKLEGDRCSGNQCPVNSNLKLMKYICSYVTCRELSCRRPVRPSGSCCRLCGQLFSVKIKENYNKERFKNWFDEMMEMYYKTEIIFNVLSVERNKFEIVISRMDDDDVPDSLANEITERIIKERILISVESVEGRSWIVPVHEENRFSQGLITVLIVLLILIIVTVLFVVRRKLPFYSYIEDNFKIHIPLLPKINLFTISFSFFQRNNPRTRLNEELGPQAASDDTVKNAIEVIELPETIAGFSFDNPIYEVETGYEDSIQ